MASTFLSFATFCNLSSYVKLVGWAHAQEDVTEDSMPPLIEMDGAGNAGAGYANGLDGDAALPEPNSLAVGVGAWHPWRYVVPKSPKCLISLKIFEGHHVRTQKPFPHHAVSDTDAI